MEKCVHCKKVIWYWQSRWLGLTPAHSRCDAIEFSAATQKLYQEGFFTMEQMQENNAKRKWGYG